MRSSFPVRALVAAVLAFASLAPASALAQSPADKSPGYVERKTDDGSAVTFIDADKLGAELRGATGGIIRPINPPRRVLLLRPRTQFVTQMLKSVENM